MKINICTLDPEEKINNTDWLLIKDSVKKHAKIGCEALSIKTLNVTIYPNKDWCIKQTGDGGYTANFDWIQVFIDPAKSVSKIINLSFPATLYHEMNHARRMIKIGFGKTLLETVISEGLAIVFAEEMFKNFEAPWGKYSEEEIKRLYKVFISHKDDENFNYQEWFLGFGKPHWLGYKIGAHIVRGLKEKGKKFSSIKLVDTPASKIYNDWYNLNMITKLK